MKKLSAKTARVRESYAARTGMNTRACKILFAAHQVKIEFIEDEDGNSIRIWKSSESSSYSNADLKACLSNRVAVEANEMLGTVPPSAIKYCVTKGWLIPHGSLYRVTLKAALELDLPMRFKGLHNGRKIPFASAPNKKAGSDGRAPHHENPAPDRLHAGWRLAAGTQSRQHIPNARGAHRDTIRLAHECRVYPNFYRSLGRDPEAAVAAGIAALKQLYPERTSR